MKHFHTDNQNINEQWHGVNGKNGKNGDNGNITEDKIGIIDEKINEKDRLHDKIKMKREKMNH